MANKQYRTDDELRQMTPEERKEYNSDYRQWSIYCFLGLIVSVILNLVLGIFGIKAIATWIQIVLLIVGIHCMLYYNNMYYLEPLGDWIYDMVMNRDKKGSSK